MATDFDKIISEYSKSEDFGFSTHDSIPLENEVKQKTSEANSLNASNIKLKENLKLVEALIMPMLVNMMNSKGDIIKWPEAKRKEQIKEQIEKLIKLTRPI